MPALPALHLCPFNFQTQDVRVVGSEVSAGPSISGIEEPIATDGGGYWQADYSGFDFGGSSEADRAVSLYWRALDALLFGGNRAVLRICDRWHQPVGDVVTVQHDDNTPFDDSTQYVSPGAEATVLAVNNGETGGLNCTSLDMSFAAEKKLIGGERFTHVHEAWGERCYQIATVADIPGGKRITFIPGVRGGINIGDPVDFDDPRCVVRRTSAPSNALTIGLYASPQSLQLVEDMRQPTA